MGRLKQIQAREFPEEENAVTEEKTKFCDGTAARCVNIIALPFLSLDLQTFK